MGTGGSATGAALALGIGGATGGGGCGSGSDGGGDGGSKGGSKGVEGSGPAEEDGEGAGVASMSLATTPARVSPSASPRGQAIPHALKSATPARRDERKRSVDGDALGKLGMRFRGLGEIPACGALGFHPFARTHS